MASISSPGIGSGLDVNGIVTKLMALEQQPITVLDQKEASLQGKLSSYGSVSGALSAFQSTMAGMSYLSTFQAYSATPVDSTILSAAASSLAAPGNYSVTVGSLAQAQSIMTSGQAATNSAIAAAASTTTLSFQFGTISGGTAPVNGVGTYSGATFTQDASQATGTVTITDSNNSLQGIRDAINAANLGVNATIVSDGGATPYHLVLTSKTTGATSSMKISVSGDAALATLLAYDPAATQNLTQTQAGQNATGTVNGLAISSATNIVSNAIQGVTLNFGKLGSTNLNVARNTDSAQSSVQAFVKAYNDLGSTLAKMMAYDPNTKKGGPMQGDVTVLGIQDRLRSLLNTTITGLGGSLTSLSQIGVSFQLDGSLALDTSKLKTALTNNFTDVAGLFAAVGSTTDSLVSYAGSSPNTKPGNYALAVTALATQGQTTGSAAVGSTTITAGTNDGLNVTVDGVSAALTIAAGTYNNAGLAAQLQSTLNGVTAFKSAGISATVSQSGGVFTITSARYGAASNVSITGGTGATNLFGATPTSTAGVNAAGTFSGVAAVGAGQYLTGAVGTPAEGLRLLINGGALGARGSVNFSQGYAYKLNDLVGKMLGTTGVVSARTDGINRSIKDIDDRRTVLTDRLATIEARYRAQFTALDNLISNFQSTGNFLTQQLGNLPGVSSLVTGSKG
jgi:flagellar hook-associated protein 2